MTGRHADVISSGRDPDRPPRLPGRWRLAAAAVVLLIGGGITASVLLAGRPAPHPRAGRPPAAHAQVVPAMLHGSPPGPDVAPGTVLLLAGLVGQQGGEDLRRVSVTGRVPARLRWADTVLGVASPLGSNPAVQVLEPVSGGFVALLASETGCCLPAVGDVFFIPVTTHGVAAPRLIAHANADFRSGKSAPTLAPVLSGPVNRVRPRTCGLTGVCPGNQRRSRGRNRGRTHLVTIVI